MGCDGGSIPKRVEMVKLKKKDEKVSARSCALTVDYADTASNRGQLEAYEVVGDQKLVTLCRALELFLCFMCLLRGARLLGTQLSVQCMSVIALCIPRYLTWV